MIRRNKSKSFTKILFWWDVMFQISIFYWLHLLLMIRRSWRFYCFDGSFFMFGSGMFLFLD